ncbi:hypothetical protein JNB63_12050 [Microbacterium trichothecenolyticum]|uniref:Uncharacterized protein n=1 Tax=Microbacterium ureisolvens TaxID=2781186 RepID=A0ABS7I191_9MICO|nr:MULTISPECIES: hypothetical protein [Microbacterium]MBW9111417.1 hypothetical protein [Microbacterium ureisolvens]MBW9120826.1 hypothetical protein [Microbacterium trichothecenolyticum]
MKRVIYAGSEFVTGDEIAATLLRLGQALAEAAEAEAVTVPTREPDGSVGEVTVLIGPASQMVARDAYDDNGELVDEGAIERMRAIQRRLHPIATVDPAASAEVDWEDEI